MKRKGSMSGDIRQPYISAHGLKNGVRPCRAEAHHWMKALIVISYAVKFLQASKERKIAYPGD